jgi:osmotically-inducible protein OsmY
MEDSMLEANVIDELKWDPRLNASKVSVSARGATITLAGVVHSYTEKCTAEAVARHVKGVGAVRNTLDVRLTIANYRTDTTLQRLATDILESLPRQHGDAPRGAVKDGWLTLEGDAETDADKRAAETAFLFIAGIRGVTNRIRVMPQSEAAEAKGAFEAAVRRRALLHVEGLRADIDGTTLKVYGVVASCAERHALLELAAFAPGIVTVEDHIVVRLKESK